MLSALLNRPLTIINRTDDGDEDEYGNAVPAEAFVDVVGELQQQRRDEPDAEGETSDTRWLLVLPAGTVIGTGDGVICDGEAFEVVGAPWMARNPRTGAVSHIEASIRRTAGDEGAS